MMTVEFTLLTLNLRNILDRYEERKPLLAAEFARLEPNIAAIQEAAYLEERQDELLAAAAPGHTYRLFDARSRRYPEFGNGLLIGLGNVEVSEELRLSNGRCALRTLVLLPGNLTMWVVTTHLHHRPDDADERLVQVNEIVRWLDAAPQADGAIVCGDFNAPPAEPAYAGMTSAGYVSAHVSIHGVEPGVTWPSGIQAEGMETGDPKCVDYIWLRGRLTASSVDLAFNRPAKNDSTLYASDHYGLIARLVLG